MSERRIASNDRSSPGHLPPRELMIHDPGTDGKLPTPLDGSGLVDVEGLIKLVKQSVDPTYDWKADINDLHHVQWPSAWYSTSPLLGQSDGPSPQKFRNQNNNLILASRTFHNHLHNLTIPPPLPDEEVMYHSNQAQKIRMCLVRSVKLASALHTKRYIRPDSLLRGESYHISTFYRFREQLQQIPDEFRLVDLSEFEPDSIEEIHHISTKVKLGKRVTMATVQQLPSRRPRHVATSENQVA